MATYSFELAGFYPQDSDTVRFGVAPLLREHYTVNNVEHFYRWMTLTVFLHTSASNELSSQLRSEM
jgi:hypothetical protein